MPTGQNDGSEEEVDIHDLLRRAGMLVAPEVEEYVRVENDLTPTEKIQLLAYPEFLTKQQAAAYVYREIEGLARSESAEEMGISTSKLDDYLRDAKDIVEAAEATLEALEAISGTESAKQKL